MKTVIKWSVLALTLCVVVGTAVATVVYPPVQYGQQCKVYFTLYDSNSPWRAYMTAPAATDVNVVKDGGTGANATNTVTRVGRQCYLLLTATEMQAAVVCVEVNDASSPKLFMDETIVIPTFGNASAFIEPNSVALVFNDVFNSATDTVSISSASKNAIVAAADANSVKLLNISNDTNSLDTASELRTLLTGGNLEVATEANMPLAASWTPTRAGYIDYLASTTYGLAAIEANEPQVANWTPARAAYLDYLASTSYGLQAIEANEPQASSWSSALATNIGTTNSRVTANVATAASITAIDHSLTDVNSLLAGSITDANDVLDANVPGNQSANSLGWYINQMWRRIRTLTPR